MWLENIVDRHAGADIYVVGTGWSLTPTQIRQVADCITIGLNNAVNIVPHLSYHLFADEKLAKEYAKKTYEDTTTVVCNEAANKKYKDYGFKQMDQICMYEHLKSTGQIDANRKEKGLYVQSTVATAAICLAWVLGARRIFLLGVDACYTKDADGKERIYCNGKADTDPKKTEKRRKDYEKANNQQADDHRWLDGRNTEWIKQFRDLREFFTAQELYVGPWPHAGIYNLSTESAVDAFPYAGGW